MSLVGVLIGIAILSGGFLALAIGLTREKVDGLAKDSKAKTDGDGFWYCWLWNIGDSGTANSSQHHSDSHHADSGGSHHGGSDSGGHHGGDFDGGGASGGHH